ncbi:MAG: pyridoxine 5'-phosphate synthase, partial [Hyphomicrobiaceae bacterium]
KIALAVKPHAVCLVPEKREERTTEGGLDVVGGHNHLLPIVGRLSEAGIRVSMFIEADPRALEGSLKLGAPVVELHTGAWCERVAEGKSEAAEAEFARIVAAARLAREMGLEPHAGHGLDFATAERIAGIAELAELNIGHFLIGEAIFTGLVPAIHRMREAMNRGRAAGAPGA